MAKLQVIQSLAWGLVEEKDLSTSQKVTFARKVHNELIEHGYRLEYPNPYAKLRWSARPDYLYHLRRGGSTWTLISLTAACQQALQLIEGHDATNEVVHRTEG